MKRGMVAGFIFALVAGLAWQSHSANLTNYTPQYCLNKLLGAKPTEYTMQQALNVILTKPAERDTLVTLFTWMWDDGSKNMWDATAWVDSFAAYNQVGTISVIGYAALHADTATTRLSPARLRALEARGWDLQGHGYTHGDSLWAASGAYAMCRGQTNRKQYMREWTRCMAAFDTLGLRTPRGFSWPNSGGNEVSGEEAAKAGFDYGFASSVTATNGTRYCYAPEIEKLLGHWYLAAYPGILPNRYEIGQSVGDATSFGIFRSTVWEGIKARGSWIVYIGHSPQGWETSNPAHGFEEALGFIDSLRTLGLIQVVTAREGYELMFETPIGPYANFMYPNLPDYDADNQLDFTDTARDSIQIGLGANVFTSRGTLDSVFVSTSRPNHGVMGCGYATTAANGVYSLTDLNGATTGNPFYGRDLQFKFLNFAPGQLVTFEFWCQVDTTIQHAMPSASDTVGVTFEAWEEAVYGVYGGSPVPLSYSRVSLGSTAGKSMAASFDYILSSPSTNYWPQPQRLSATDIVGGTWKHVQGRWTVPPWAHYIYVNIVQDKNLKTNALRISNLSITKQARTQGQTW
jgi:hypothetical protein